MCLLFAVLAGRQQASNRHHIFSIAAAELDEPYPQVLRYARITSLPLHCQVIADSQPGVGSEMRPFYDFLEGCLRHKSGAVVLHAHASGRRSKYVAALRVLFIAAQLLRALQFLLRHVDTRLFCNIWGLVPAVQRWLFLRLHEQSATCERCPPGSSPPLSPCCSCSCLPASQCFDSQQSEP